MEKETQKELDLIKQQGLENYCIHRFARLASHIATLARQVKSLADIQRKGADIPSRIQDVSDDCKMLGQEVNRLNNTFKALSRDHVELATTVDGALSRIETKMDVVLDKAVGTQEMLVIAKVLNTRLGMLEEMHQIWPCSGEPENPIKHPYDFGGSNE